MIKMDPLLTDLSLVVGLIHIFSKKIHDFDFRSLSKEVL